MSLVWWVYVIVPVVTIPIQLFLAYWVYTYQRDVRGSKWFVLTLILGAAWLVFHLIMIAGTGREVQWVSMQLGYKVGVASFVTWAIFAFRYSYSEIHRRPLGRIVVGLLVVDLLVPSFLDPIRDVWYGGVTYYTEPITYVSAGYAVPSALRAIFMGTLFVVAVGVLVRYLLSTGGNSTVQVGLILAGAAPIPLFIGLGAAGLLPADELYHGPYGLLFFSLFTSLALFKYRLFDVQPVARNAVFEEFQDPVFVFDADWCLADYNRSVIAIGFDLVDAIGEPFEDVVPSIADVVDRPIAEGTTSTQVTLDVNGEPRHYSVNASPVSATRSDETVWYSIVLRDVTDLEQSRWQLQTQNDRLDQVASTISHDLRNPINVAQGYETMLVDIFEEVDTDDDTQDLARQYFSKLEQSHERMLDIIADILTIAREGKSVEETEPVDLDVAARSAWENVATGAATLSVTGDATLQADRSKLLTVFENMFRNAVEHGPEGVHVEVGPTDDGFYVQDDGPGIDDQHREQVFEYGYSTTSGTTGLGLSIVRTMAESHGWTVDVDESYTDGARFVFSTTGEAHGSKEERQRVAPVSP